MSKGDSVDFKRGEADGRKDGAAGVKALGLTIQNMIYSAAYRAGYASGYGKAAKPLHDSGATESRV